MLLLGQFFVINAKIENIVFHITLKVKKVFFKELSRFNKIISAINVKKVFRSKNFLRSKNHFLGLKSQKTRCQQKVNKKI